jgi:hypothetical protein
MVIQNRRQLNDDGSTTNGYWIVSDSLDSLGAHVLLAQGFVREAATARMVCDSDIHTSKSFGMVVGRYEPTEEIQAQVAGGEGTSEELVKTWGQNRVFDSVAIPQLINVLSKKPIAVYSGFIVLQSSGFSALLEPIKIGVQKDTSQLNLLSAFYFVEWMLFAGFAVFLWFRLVQDERDRLAELEGETVAKPKG